MADKTVPIPKDATIEPVAAQSPVPIPQGAQINMGTAAPTLPPEQPGLLRRLGQSMGVPTSIGELGESAIDTGIGLLPAGSMLNQAVNYAVGVGKSLQSGYRDVTEAVRNIRDGGPVVANIGKAGAGATDIYLSAMPLGGPQVKSIGEDVASGNLRGATGTSIGVAFQAVTAGGAGKSKSLGKLGEKTPAKLVQSGMDTVFRFLVPRAGKGGVKAEAMAKDMAVSTPHIADVVRKTPEITKGKVYEVASKMAEALDNAAMELWDKGHKPGIERNGHTPINHEALYQSGRNAITKEAIDANPAEGASAIKWLDESINKPRDLASLDKLIREVNDDLKSASAERITGYGNLGVRVRMAVMDAARKMVDDTLANFGEQGVLEHNRAYGAMRAVSDRLKERAVEEYNRAAKAGPVPPYLHLYSFIHPTSGSLPVTLGAGFGLSEFVKSAAGFDLSAGLLRLAKSGVRPAKIKPPVPRLKAQPSPPDTSGITVTQDWWPGAQDVAARGATGLEGADLSMPIPEEFPNTPSPLNVPEGVPIPEGVTPTYEQFAGRPYEQRQPYNPYPPDVVRTLPPRKSPVKLGKGNWGKLPHKQTFKSK